VTTALTWILQAFILYLGATFVFDAIHWALHAAYRSSVPALRFLGAFHQTHHAFLDRSLTFDDRLIGPNFWRHRAGELLAQLAGTCAGFFFLPPEAVFATLAIFTFVFAVGVVLKGKDSNHRAQTSLSAPLGSVFVGLPYHSLHHVFPERYFGSVTTAFDRLFGTGCQIAGRHVVLTGASGAFGAPLKALLEQEGATVTALARVAFATADLSTADILILAHGSKVTGAMEANCDSFVGLIERFRAHRKGLVPPEVWAVGSEIECHPAFSEDLRIYSASKRAFARHAHRYFHAPDLLYRHIVPSAFTSAMGPGLMSGGFAAAYAWFLIKRGFRYVPVSYTGIAWVNYLKFAVIPKRESPC